MINDIANAGHTSVALNNLSAAQLAGIDILYLWNDSNFGWGTAINFQADVMNAVNNGLQVVAFDRSANRFSDAPSPKSCAG